MVAIVAGSTNTWPKLQVVTPGFSIGGLCVPLVVSAGVFRLARHGSVFWHRCVSTGPAHGGADSTPTRDYGEVPDGITRNPDSAADTEESKPLPCRLSARSSESHRFG